MKILMGIDGSKFSEDVLRAIVKQFRTENTEVRVLHVLQPSAPAPPQMAQATLLNWTIKRNQPVSWSSELRTSCVVPGSRSTPLSRLVTSERESSIPQQSGVPI